MEMRERIDAVAPGIIPAVPGEDALDARRRILLTRDVDRAAIDEERQRRIVGNQAVVTEPHRDGGDRIAHVRGLRHGVGSGRSTAKPWFIEVISTLPVKRSLTGWLAP